jgi:large subunit ribosomal protein L9
MKLVLTHHVRGLGEPGDLVEVKDGYGRNYLLPRRLAAPATRGVERQVAALRRARDARAVHDLDEARRIADRLAAQPVRLRARAGGSGRLFGSVTTADIAEAVAASAGPVIDRRRVEIAAPIRTVGEHTVTVRVHPEVSAELTVDVVSQD